jgi:translation elongation factor EF-Tu-like GTPase
VAKDADEADWRVFRELRAIALERFCERVLSEVTRLATDPEKKSHHERYLAVYSLVKERDGEIAAAFNDFRRSTFVRQMAIIQYHKLLTEQEMARLSPRIRQSVEAIIDIIES